MWEGGGFGLWGLRVQGFGFGVEASHFLDCLLCFEEGVQHFAHQGNPVLCLIWYYFLSNMVKYGEIQCFLGLNSL